MPSCDVRNATPEDIRRWFEGGLPPYSIRAVVLEVDGKLEGLGGVMLVNGYATCFSTLSTEARGYKRKVVEAIRLVRKILQDYPHVVAYATEGEPTADVFIRHVGFKHLGSSVNGEVYSYE